MKNMQRNPPLSFPTKWRCGIPVNPFGKILTLYDGSHPVEAMAVASMCSMQEMTRTICFRLYGLLSLWGGWACWSQRD
jgi:hypothetical protein